MSSQTIVQVLTSGNEGGGQVVALSVARRMVELGYIVRFASPSDGPLAEAARSIGEVDMIGGRSLKDVGAIASIAGFLKNTQPALIHTHTPIAATLMWRLAAKYASVPIVHHVHATNFYGSGLKSKVVAVVDRLTVSYPKRFIAVSKATAAAIIENGYPSAKVDVLHNPVTWPRQQRKNTDLKAAPVVACIGRITPVKAQDVVVDAFRSVLSEFPSAQLWIVGAVERDYESYLRRVQAAASHDRLNGAVTFLGHRSDVRDILARADLLVLPSFEEALPLVLLEAMSVGVPVVATPVGGVTEIVTDEQTGLLVPAGDSSRLAGAIRRMLDDSKLRESMAAAAHEAVYEKFSDAMTIDRTVAMIDSEAKSARRG